MRRILIGCLAAAAVLLLSQQKASAWCNFNFSTGVNVGWQSGGCRLLWGLVETAPGPNSSFGGCGDQMQCQPQRIPMGAHAKDFFGNLFGGGYNQFTPDYGYGGCGSYPGYGGDCGAWNYPQYGYYQYPQYGFYQYPGAEKPVIANK